MTAVSGVFLQQWDTIGVFFLFVLISWYYWSHWKILKAARKLPQVFYALPIVGHAYLALRGYNWVLNFGVKIVKRYLLEGGDKGVFWVGPYPFFMITDPEEIQTLLNNTKSFEGGIEHHMLGYALGNGLITAPVSDWKLTRRHMNPLFHPYNLQLRCPSMNECGRDLVASLTQHVDSGLVDVEPLVEPIILKSMCKLLFGPEAEVNMESNKFKNLMKAITRISQLMAHRFFKIHNWLEPIFKMLYKKDIEAIEESCNGFFDESMKAFKNRRRTQTETQIQEDSKIKSRSHGGVNIQPAGCETALTIVDAYQILHENYPSFTEKYLNFEMRNLFIGGSESSRVTLSSCILMLAAHPPIQEKLYSEIVSVTGPQDSDVTPEDIRAMPYLDQVLKETLRKFLVIPLVTRRVQGDLKFKDWTIPKGALVGALIFAVHHNPKLYPEPERFDPDRFSPENVATRGRYSFIPFSGGPRNCIGKNYAMLVLKTLLVHVVRRFKFSTTVDFDSQQLIGGSICSLQGGYRVEVEAR